jgi:nitrate reductase NapE component
LGEVDRWGTKWELIILPIVGAFIFVLMEVLEKYPEVHNYPQRFNESNAEKFYLLSRKLVNQLKNICLIIFALILFESVSIALGWGYGFGMWFLPITILGTGVPIVVGIIKQKKIT